MNQTSRKILAQNLKALKSHEKRHWSDKELSRRSKVSDRMIGRILAGESSASVDILDKLAKPFNLTAWQLLADVENINELSQFNELFNNYNRSTDERKEYILSVAEREADYSAGSPALKRALDDIEEVTNRVTKPLIKKNRKTS